MVITRPSWRWAVVTVLCVSVVAGFFDRISIAVLFNNPSFYDAIGIGFDPVRLGLLMTVFLVSYGLSSLFLGSIGDVISPRIALAAATAIWAVLMFITAVTSSYWVMIACRIGLGLAEGPQFALISKIVKGWFPAHEHGRAHSLWLIGSPIGSAAGFPLTIWIVASFGWRASFFALGVFSLFVVMPLVLLVVRDSPGAAAIAPRNGMAAPHRVGRDLGALVRNGDYWLLLIGNCGTLIYLWGLNSWLPTYLERARHFSLEQMGIYSSLPFILLFLGEISSGVVSDLIGRRALLCFIGLFGAGALIGIGSQVTEPHAAAIIIAVSAGFWGVSLPAVFALATDLIPASLTATGIGWLNGIGNLVGAAAPVIMGWVIAMSGGNFAFGLLVIVAGSVICSGFYLALHLRHSHARFAPPPA